MFYRHSRQTRFAKKSFGRGKLSKYDLLRQIEDSKRSLGSAVPANISIKNSFGALDLAEELKRNIIRKGYTALTPIQDQVIPLVILNRDVIGIANTGTGKTAAFLIPLINKVFRDRNQKVLIITPTRELAQQINEELGALSFGMRIFSALCTGGNSKYTQVKALRQNPNFVVGTPGRLRDLIQQRVLDISKCNNVVLDETDRMVDIGFIDEIKYFISLLPKERQSLFFSATVSFKIREIINTLVKNPVTVSTKVSETTNNIKQEVIQISGNLKKIDKLHDLLIQKEFSKVLVFGKTKWGVEKLSVELLARGFKVGSIHGDKRQGQRQRTLAQFKANEIKILLATDVASRGLDIKDISHVINYDLPETYEDYVHRIGRTGRVGKAGIAVTLID